MPFKKIVLSNGVRLLFVPQPTSVAAVVLILVKAGSEYETKPINGISHFLEHLVFKGTKKRPHANVIAHELESLGAKFNAFTAQEYTGYWAKAEAGKIDAILEIVSDLYLNPLFDSQEIDKERGVVVEEINMYEDLPMRRVHELFTSLMYGDQPAGWDIAGNKEIIRTVPREKIIEYRKAHYVPSGTVVVIAGKYDEKKIEKDVKAYFENLKKAPSVLKVKTKFNQKAPRADVKFKESDQSHLVLGVPAFDLFDPRRYALQVIADILGGGMSSRLFRRVREELGAAYYVNADADLFLDHGYFAASAGVDHQKIDLVLKAMLEEFKKLTTTFVPMPELNKSKDHMIGNLMLGLETSDELAGYYGVQEMLTEKLVAPEELVRRIRKVTREDVRRVAEAIFKTEKLNFMAIGPFKDKERFQKLLKL